MNFRTAAIATAVLLTATALVGCQPTPAPAPSDDSPASSTPKPTETQEQEVQLPADAVFGLSAHATADNGAEVDIQLVLLKPEPLDSPAGVERANATIAWCDGEVDQAVLEAEGGTSFAELDVTVSPVDGTPAWPTDLPMHVYPSGGEGFPTMTPAGGAYGVQRPDDSGSDDGGYYIPHCLQDAFVPAPGTGSVYLGWGNDETVLMAWATSYYGATFELFGEPVGAPRATLSDCSRVITELGESMGGSNASLPEFFSDLECRAGSV